MANILRCSFDSKDEWPIKDVTVYDDRAQIVRILKYKTTDAGEAELKLTNLPTSVKPESIRAEIASLNASVLEVTSEIVTSQAPVIKVLPRETEIQEILKHLVKEEATITNREQVLNSYYQNMVPGNMTETTPPPMPVRPILPVQNQRRGIEAKLERFLKPKLVQQNRQNAFRVPDLPPHIQANNFTRPLAELFNFGESVSSSSAPVFKDEDQNELFEQMGSQENLQQFAQALDTYFIEISKLRKRKTEIQKEVKTLTNERDSIYKEKIQKAVELRKTSTEASVLISVPEETVVESGIVEVKLIYVVGDCLWKANYDVRVSKQEGVVELAYFGQVTNSSGEDWNEVQLYLSTAKPSREGSLPTLPRANVRYIPKYVMPRRRQQQRDNIDLDDMARVPGFARKSHRSMAMRAEDFDTAQVQQELKEIAKVDQSTAEDRGGSATFKLNRLCSIESDSRPHKQKIGNVTLTPQFTYVMTPKLTPFAYLMCTATNDSSFIFVRGPMSVFFNGSYVTKSNMKLVNKNQKFKVFLGKDETVKLNITPPVSRKEVTKGGIMTSKTNKETFTRTVKIENTGVEDIEVMVYEQVPLSRDNKIKVDILKPVVEGNKKCKINHFNQLELKRKMKAGKSWDFVFSYRVEWPKNSEVVFTESLENMER